MTSKQAFLQKIKAVTKFNHQKIRFYLNKIVVFGVTLSQRSPRIMSSANANKKNINVQVASAFLLKCSFNQSERFTCKSDSDFFLMPSNKKNVNK